MATRVASFLARKKTGPFLGPCWTYLCGTVGLYICAIFFLFLSAEMMVLGRGEDLFINYVGMKKMEIFLDYSRFGRHSGVVSAHPRDFCVLPFPGLVFEFFSVFLRPFHKSLRCLPYSSSLRSKSSSSLQIIRSLVPIPCTKLAGEWQLDGGK